MNLSVSQLYTFSRCRHKDIGILKKYCRDYSIGNLREGLNLIECDLNGNGWALTNCLCNPKMKNSDVEGRFFLNRQQIELSDIRKISYYICESDFSFWDRYVLKKIGSIINRSDDYVYGFLQDNKVLERETINLGNWKYIVSFYIGYQKEKVFLDFRGFLIQKWSFKTNGCGICTIFQ